MWQNIFFGALILFAVGLIELAIVVVFHFIFKALKKAGTKFYTQFFKVLIYINYIILGGFTLMVYSDSLREIGVLRYLVMTIVFLLILGIQKIVYWVLKIEK